MANTYIAIATTTVGSGGAANIEFTSIPGTYTDLCVLMSLKTTRSSAFDNLEVILNSNTSTIYTIRSLRGSGTAASSTTTTNDNKFALVSGINGSTSGDVWGNALMYIPNYAGSANKAVSFDTVTEWNNTQAESHLAAGIFASTSAITTIKIQGGFNLQQYSTATLYGIKNT